MFKLNRQQWIVGYYWVRLSYLTFLIVTFVKHHDSGYWFLSLEAITKKKSDNIKLLPGLSRGELGDFFPRWILWNVSYDAGIRLLFRHDLTSVEIDVKIV